LASAWHRVPSGSQLTSDFSVVSTNDVPYRQAAVNAAPEGRRLTARKAYAIGIWLLIASILIQVMLAGAGVFANDATFFFWHANINSAVVFFLPLILIGIGWYGRIPRRTLWLTAAVSGLVIVQSILLIPYHAPGAGAWRALAGLHAVNALFIFLVAVRLLERVKELDRIPEGDPRIR
jgi:hypothetical protein